MYVIYTPTVTIYNATSVRVKIVKSLTQSKQLFKTFLDNIGRDQQQILII
jgi:hypothetical protein